MAFSEESENEVVGSDKFTPIASEKRGDVTGETVSGRRLVKLQGKESSKVKKLIGQMEEGSTDAGQTKRVLTTRQTRKQAAEQREEEAAMAEQGEGRLRRQRRGLKGKSASGEAH